jgi:hypothetical protein
MVILTHEEFGSALQHLTIIADHHVASLLGFNSRVNGQPLRGLQRLRGESHQPAQQSSEHLQMMLDRIFNRIESLRTLKLVSAPSDLTSPVDDIDLDRLPRTKMLSETSFLMVLSAISQGNTRISRFEVGSHREDGRHYLNIMSLNAGSIELYKKGLRKLNSIRELTLNLHVDFNQLASDPSAWQQEERVAAEFPIAFLGLIPNLDVLDLAMSSPHDMVPKTFFEAISYSYRPTRLIKCVMHFCNVQITLQDMERFFRNCTLIKCIHLEGLHLVMVGDVEETVEAFRNMFGKMELDTCTVVSTAIIGYNSRREVSDEHWVPGIPGHWVDTDSGHPVQ